MSIDFSTKLNRPFTFGHLRQRTESTLDELLGLPSGTLSVTLLDSDDYHPARPLTAMASLSAARRDAMLRPYTVDASCILAMPERSAAVYVSIYYDPLLKEYDDHPELGTRCHIDCGIQRRPLSYALGIAAIIAAAELTEDVVWDSWNYLNHGEPVQPRTLRRAFTAVDPSVSLTAAVARLMSLTRLTQPGDFDNEESLF